MRRVAMLLVVMGLAVAPAAAAVPLEYPEGDLWGFPALTDRQGKLLGRGRFGQRVDARGVHVTVTYDQLNGDKIEEKTLLSTTGGELAQREWSWQRTSGGQVVERYVMDFDAQEGRSLVVREGKQEQHRGKLEVVEGRTFAGIGFVFAVRNLYPRLVRGERLELEGIAFTPRPRKATVRISSAGVETVRSGGRSLRAEHIVVHPQLPKVAELFVYAPDSHLWFFRARPPEFIRAEMQMQSLGVVRIDSVGGDGAQAAQAAQARPRPPSR